MLVQDHSILNCLKCDDSTPLMPHSMYCHATHSDLCQIKHHGRNGTLALLQTMCHLHDTVANAPPSSPHIL